MLKFDVEVGSVWKILSVEIDSKETETDANNQMAASAPSEEVTDTATQDSSCTPKLDVVELFATAVFENSPYSQLHQDEFQSLGRFAKQIAQII